jgi:DNA-binding NtrC family response regulator
MLPCDDQIIQIQVTLTDLRMDEMDGMQLCKVIQQDYPTLPVIIITAHGTIKEAVEATSEGVFGVRKVALINWGHHLLKGCFVC